MPFYGSTASKRAVLSAIQDDLAPKLGPRDRVLVFFAGHGKTERLGGETRGYIVPYDGGSHSSSLISMDEIRDQSSYMGLARQQLFILDSCFGGLLAVMRDSIVDPREPDYVKHISERYAREVLTAGDQDQQVLDSGRDGHSFFMAALLEGIQDGLADLNGDGYITFPELVAYVTPRASNRYQTPGEGVLPGHQEGEFLFKNPKGAGRPAPERSTIASALRGGEDISHTAAYVALGDASLGLGDWDEAMTLYREALRVDPSNVKAHDGLAAVLSYRDDWDGVILRSARPSASNPTMPRHTMAWPWHWATKGTSTGRFGRSARLFDLSPITPKRITF